MTLDPKALKPCPFCGAKAWLRDYANSLARVECDDCQIGTLHLKQTANATTAWNTRTGAEPVAIKALEWSDEPKQGHGQGRTEGDAFVIWTTDGSLYLLKERRETERTSYSCTIWRANTPISSHGDRRKAKAAAQADFEARIRSCIVPAEPVAWRTVADIPTVNKGGERQLVVAVRRARSGKVHTFPAYYLNGYPIHYEDVCKNCPGEGNGCGAEDGDGCPTTGWFTCAEGGEWDYTYSRLHLDPGDEHVGWCEFPVYPAALTATLGGDRG